MEEVRHPKPQRVPCLKIAGLSYPNRGMIKDSYLYIRNYLFVKWFTHLTQGQKEWCVWQLFKKMTEKTSRKAMRDIQKDPTSGGNCKRKEEILKSETKFMVRRARKKQTIRHTNDTYNCNLSHLCRVRGFHYLRNLYVDQRWWYKCTSSYRI